MKRRTFLKTASLGAASLSAGRSARPEPRPSSAEGEREPAHAYKLRIAFGAWINDMRLEPLPLENWPAPQLDDLAVESVTRALDVQSAAGFNLLDAWGLFATYGWPPDIESALDEERRRRIQQILDAAKERGMRVVYGLGTYSWGYDRIIEADPAVRGKDSNGQPHAHAMCDANPRAFDYVKRILDFVLSRFDFAGIHIESCDLGCCMCPQCAGKEGVVAYNVRINAKTADYIRSRWPGKLVYVIPINWIPPLKNFTAEDKARIVELSRRIDAFMDQGWTGTMVVPAERPEFIRALACDYGTSGGLWLYPDARWDRAAYFLPYCRRTGRAIQQHFGEGARACMFYQGPVNNPSTEVNIAVGGRILKDTRRSVEEALDEVIELYYKPKSPAAHKRLVQVFQRAEESYFEQWSEKRFLDTWKVPLPGEFKLDQHLFGTSPGPATFLCEPFLDATGRLAYKKGLVSILEELPKIRDSFDDGGRIDRITRSIIVTLMLLNTVAYSKGETAVLGG